MNPYRIAVRVGDPPWPVPAYPRVVAERDGTRLVAIDAGRWHMETRHVTAHTDAMGQRSETVTWRLIQEIRRMTEAEREKAERYPSVYADLRKGEAMAVIIEMLAGSPAGVTYWRDEER